MRWVDSWAELEQHVAAARAALGLTQAQAADRADFERTALVKIERGQRQVSALELSRLATALRRPLDWFLRESPPAVISRRQGRLEVDGLGPLDELVERVTRDVELVASLHLLSSAPARRALALPASVEEAELVAQRVRDELAVDDAPLVDLLAAAEQLGLLGFVLDVQDSELDGVYVSLDPARRGVAVVNGRHQSGRRRFTLAHELGNHIFADQYATDWALSDASSQPERMINAFAVHLLLPGAAAGRRWEELDGQHAPREAALRLALEYRLSWSALCAHLRNRALISSSEYAHLAANRPRSVDYLDLGAGPVEDLLPPALPPEHVQAVLRGFRQERLGAGRTVELLWGTVALDDLPARGPLPEEVLYGELGGPL